MSRILATRLALPLLAAVLPVSAEIVRIDAPTHRDAYGYLVLDPSDRRCGFAFVDIDTIGETLQFTGAGPDPGDEGGALLPLEEPFELYGSTVESLVVSTNGYLAAASSLALEGGGDFSNDERLPALPDHAPASPARLLVYHDDLDSSDSGGSATSRHFSVCPRPSDALAAEACTIVQWTDFDSPEATDPFTLQAVLYHRSFEIVFQIRPGPSRLRGGTIGIQNRTADTAAQYATPDLVLASDRAVCFFEPRFPPGGAVADLELINTDKIDEAEAGQRMTYAVSVINHGPSPVAGARVANPLPSTLSDCTWTCEASAGSSCTAAGTSSIDDTVDVAPEGYVDYTLTCYATQSPAPIVHTASVGAPPGVNDPDPTNDSATDVDRVFTRARLACPARRDLIAPAPNGEADTARCAASETERAGLPRR